MRPLTTTLAALIALSLGGAAVPALADDATESTAPTTGTARALGTATDIVTSEPVQVTTRRSPATGLDGAARAGGTRVFPVPTSSAGLGRIVTAPNGNLWFAMEDANKVGRLTPSGQFLQVSFGEPDDASISDLDVAPDGTVWVLFDSGRMVGQLDANGQGITQGEIGTFGQQIRVDRAGTVWITKSFDQEAILYIRNNTINESPNAPDCEDSLGEGRDGRMYCRNGAGLIRVNPNGDGGVTYPAGRFAAYPYAIADGGPTGSVWFGRYFGGTIFTSPDDGEVGYLDTRTSRIRTFNTGERTAPHDLVAGPGGEMWFASIGAAAGVGHVTPAGRGALTRIGGYEPEHLTIGRDRAVWSTDPTNNVILRTPREQLRTTNVDPGKGSVLLTSQAGRVTAPRKPIAVRKNRVGVPVACSRDARGGCRGTARITTARGGKAVTRTARYVVRPGKRKPVQLALTAQGKRLLPRGKAVKVKVALVPQGAKRPSTTKVVRVRR